MNGSKLLAQFSWISAGRLIAAFLQALTMLITAAVLGPTDFGLLASAIALAIIPQTLSDLGVTTFILRTRASDAADSRLTYALRVNDRASWLGALLYAIAVCVCAATISWALISLLPLAVWLAAEKNCEVWLSVAVADHDARLNVSVLIARRAGALGLMLLLQLASLDAMVSFTVAQAVTSLIAACAAHRLIGHRLPALTPVKFRDLLRVTRSYWIHTMATQVRNLDSALTALVAGPYQAGLYSVASRLTNPLRILPTSLVAVVIPQISRDKGRVSRGTKKLLAATVAGMTLLYLGIGVVAPVAVPALLGDAYAASVLPIQIVCVGLVFGVTASILAGVLQAKGFGALVGAASVATSVFVVLAMVILAAIAGAVGAAIALMASFFLQTAIMMVGFLLTRRPKNSR